LKEHSSCLISGANDLFALKGYENNFLVKSKSSGFVFCAKIPTDNELLSHYENYPVGYNLDLSITRKRINEVLDGFEKYRIHNKILDVGCGPGIFLLEAKKRGWEVFGTEFTDKQITFLQEKGITAKKGKLSIEMFEKSYFDVIVSSEVIEHINNPLEELNLFHRMLRKGGLVYITTPNFNAIERYLLRGKYEIIEYPEHLCYYTPKTIDLLLRNTGFKKVRITTTGISIAHIRRSLNAKKVASNDELKQYSDEKLRQSLEKGWKNEFKKLINQLLNRFKLGNSLKAWYVKV
jgi:2-polyprenyl-3-methyl-5-hydroxy-6-metoxy-1,4-benzoquinol methylase